MKKEEFNNKYKKYIEKGFKGLEFDILEVTEYLDEIFEKELTKIGEFNFAQIKLKFGKARFYSNLNSLFGKTGSEIEVNIEYMINNIITHIDNNKNK